MFRELITYKGLTRAREKLMSCSPVAPPLLPTLTMAIMSTLQNGHYATIDIFMWSCLKFQRSIPSSPWRVHLSFYMTSPQSSSPRLSALQKLFSTDLYIFVSLEVQVIFSLKTYFQAPLLFSSFFQKNSDIKSLIKEVPVQAVQNQLPASGIQLPLLLHVPVIAPGPREECQGVGYRQAQAVPILLGVIITKHLKRRYVSPSKCCQKLRSNMEELGFAEDIKNFGFQQVMLNHALSQTMQFFHPMMGFFCSHKWLIVMSRISIQLNKRI